MRWKRPVGVTPSWRDERVTSLSINSSTICGETDMADKGSKDKGKKEKQKKALLTPKEKRKARKDKKNK
jgi:hypothetical protein